MSRLFITDILYNISPPSSLKIERYIYEADQHRHLNQRPNDRRKGGAGIDTDILSYNGIIRGLIQNFPIHNTDMPFGALGDCRIVGNHHDSNTALIEFLKVINQFIG